MFSFCILFCIELAEGFQTKMASEQKSILRKQMEELQEANTRLMKATPTSDGLRRVKIKLDESETEMVNTCWPHHSSPVIFRLVLLAATLTA